MQKLHSLTGTFNTSDPLHLAPVKSSGTGEWLSHDWAQSCLNGLLTHALQSTALDTLFLRPLAFACCYYLCPTPALALLR